MSNDSDVLSPLREAAREGGDLRERVRALVLSALVERQADPKAIRSVMQDAVTGLGEGLSGHAEIVGDSLSTAMTGLDEALGKGLYALQAAVEESWGNGRRFAESDLREAYDAVRGLDDDLVGTLREVGGRAGGVLNEEFSRLGEHFGRNGTDTGAQLRSVLAVLARDMGATAGDTGRDLRADAREATGRLAQVSSGILRGLADALDGRKD